MPLLPRRIVILGAATACVRLPRGLPCCWSVIVLIPTGTAVIKLLLLLPSRLVGTVVVVILLLLW
jgi:hypothetical protein